MSIQNDKIHTIYLAWLKARKDVEKGLLCRLREKNELEYRNYLLYKEELKSAVSEFVRVIDNIKD